MHFYSARFFLVKFHNRNQYLVAKNIISIIVSNPDRVIFAWVPPGHRAIHGNENNG